MYRRRVAGASFERERELSPHAAHDPFFLAAGARRSHQMRLGKWLQVALLLVAEAVRDKGRGGERWGYGAGVSTQRLVG